MWPDAIYEQARIGWVAVVATHADMFGPTVPRGFIRQNLAYRAGSRGQGTRQTVIDTLYESVEVLMLLQQVEPN